jgi:hypothetical protein
MLIKNAIVKLTTSTLNALLWYILVNRGVHFLFTLVIQCAIKVRLVVVGFCLIVAVCRGVIFIVISLAAEKTFRPQTVAPVANINPKGCRHRNDQQYQGDDIKKEA